MMYSIKELLSLEALLSGNYNSKSSAISATTINSVLNKSLSGNMSEVSISTTRRAISKFYQDGFVDRGINNGKHKTYFITEKGKEFINECIGEDEE